MGLCRQDVIDLLKDSLSLSIRFTDPSNFEEMPANPAKRWLVAELKFDGETISKSEAVALPETE